MQKTIARTVTFKGTGLHKGQSVKMDILPAAADYGIVFERTDVNTPDRIIEANFLNITDTTLNTRLGGDVYVSTIEHLMASFAGLGISNAHVKIDGPEVPIMDGSSKEFTASLWKAGIIDQNEAARIFVVTKTVRVSDDKGAYAELRPGAGFNMSYEIDFPNTAVGAQSAQFNLNNGVFLRELSNCRTFCKQQDVVEMRAHGLGLGGNLSNAVVVDGMTVLNPEGFRRSDEAVRHKMLDALGDLYLVGGFIIGHYHGHRAGHRLTNMLLREAWAQGAFDIQRAQTSILDQLPGHAVNLHDLQFAS